MALLVCFKTIQNITDRRELCSILLKREVTRNNIEKYKSKSYFSWVYHPFWWNRKYTNKGWVCLDYICILYKAILGCIDHSSLDPWVLINRYPSLNFGVLSISVYREPASESNAPWFKSCNITVTFFFTKEYSANHLLLIKIMKL